MAVTKEQKKAILEKLIADMKDSKSIVFYKNLGLSVDEAAQVRTLAREKQGKVTVAKKTLIRLAAKEIGVESIPDETMDGAIGVLFNIEDAVGSTGDFHKFAKKTEKLQLMGGILDGALMDGARVKHLATLPSREELLAKLVGSMKAPISGFHGVLNNTLSGFVRVVDAYKDKLEKEGA